MSVPVRRGTRTPHAYERDSRYARHRCLCGLAEANPLHVTAALAGEPSTPTADPYYLPMDCPVCGRRRVMWNGTRLRCEKCTSDSEWDGFTTDRYAALAGDASPDTASAETTELLRRLDAWQEGQNVGPLVRWAAAHLRGCPDTASAALALREALSTAQGIISFYGGDQHWREASAMARVLTATAEAAQRIEAEIAERAVKPWREALRRVIDEFDYWAGERRPAIDGGTVRLHRFTEIQPEMERALDAARALATTENTDE